MAPRVKTSVTGPLAADPEHFPEPDQAEETSTETAADGGGNKSKEKTR